MVMTLRGWEGHKHRAVREKFFAVFVAFFAPTSGLLMRPPTQEGVSAPLHSDRVSSNQNMAARHPPERKKVFDGST